MKFNYQFVLLSLESCRFLLAGGKVRLGFDSVLLDFLRQIDKRLQLFLEVADFSIAYSQHFLVLDRQFKLLLQALDMQFHLLLATNVMPALGLELAKDLLVLFVGLRDGGLAALIVSLALRYL